MWQALDWVASEWAAEAVGTDASVDVVAAGVDVAVGVAADGLVGTQADLSYH